jgi:hypothetical protein
VGFSWNCSHLWNSKLQRSKSNHIQYDYIPFLIWSNVRRYWTWVFVVCISYLFVLEKGLVDIKWVFHSSILENKVSPIVDGILCNILWIYIQWHDVASSQLVWFLLLLKWDNIRSPIERRLCVSIWNRPKVVRQFQRA